MNLRDGQPRLCGVDGQAFLLAFEFGHGDILQLQLHGVGGLGQARPQAVQARGQGRDAFAELRMARRLLLLRARQRGVAFAGLRQRGVGGAQALLRLPAARVEVLAQLPDQRAGRAAQALGGLREVVDLGRAGPTRCSGQRGLATRHTLQQAALAFAGKGFGVALGLRALQLVGQRVAALRQRGDVGRAAAGTRGRQFLGEGQAAVVQHVGIGAQLVQPLLQVGIEKLQVAQVLEGFLEDVTSEQRRQVRGVRHLGQRPDVELAAQALVGTGRVGGQQTPHQLAGTDGHDGVGQRLVFLLEALGRLLVTLQRAVVRAQLGQCVGHCDARFQHRGVGAAGRATAGQFGPGHERQLGVVHLGGGPAEAQQRLVRLRPVQAHALQRGAGFAMLLGGDRGEAERDVGAITQATQLLVRCRRLADLLKQGQALVHIADLEQRHTQVEACVEPRVRAGFGVGLQRVQHAGGAVEVFTQHHQLGVQKLSVFFQRAAQRGGYA